MTSGVVAAVDLGATSGRVVLGRVGSKGMQIRPIARFANEPVELADGLHWDLSTLYSNIKAGISAAARYEPKIRSIGVDSWAVDYALLNDDFECGEPFHYRDARNLAAALVVHSKVSPADLYSINGLQYLPFNTLYQLTADRIAGTLAQNSTALLIPDLINYWLTGEKLTERTNASTTGLLNVSTRDWDAELFSRLELPQVFPPLVDAGAPVGKLSLTVAATLGISRPISVTAVGSHDTASAVVGTPATTDDFAYISCGTWGLVGVELEYPVLSEASRVANFTNEGGVDGRVRYLHNVMGLWLLSESVRTWQQDGTVIHLPTLLDEAAELSTRVPTFDPNDERFLSPGDIPSRIAEWCREHNAQTPKTRPEFVRSILETLADTFVSTVQSATQLSGKKVKVIYIVGGGAQNSLLCQLIADRSGLEVHAGPVEATAIGNMLVQARAQGLLSGSLESMRSVVSKSFPTARFRPR